MGLIQNSIALPTTAHFLDQKRALFQKIKLIIDTAGTSGVKILCLQVRVMKFNHFDQFIFLYFLKLNNTFHVMLI